MQLLHHSAKSLLILIFIALILFDVSCAQTSVEAGISVGFNRHTFSIENNHNSLQPGLALAGTYGLPIVIKRKKWELHTGFFANDLSQAFYFRAPNGVTYGRKSFSNGISSYKIPLKVGRMIRWTRVTTLSPQIGFSWLTNRRTDVTGSGGGSYGSAVEYTFETRAENKNKFMAEAGLDLNVLIFRGLTFTFGAHYSLGLQPMEKIDVTYQINNETNNDTVNSKGTGWKFNAGLGLSLFKK